MKNGIALVLLIAALAGGITYVLLAWIDHPKRPNYSGYPGSYGPGYDYTNVEFKDDVANNFEVAPEKFPLEFVDREGKKVQLSDYHGKKNVVLVFMRGVTRVPGGVCPTCTTQTSRLQTNYAEFAKREAEVLVVYPGDRDQGNQFVAAVQSGKPEASLPFPVLLDPDFQAVDRLGIRGDAARPSTFLLDRKGAIRFAYVGETSTDRPSLKALYQQLDLLLAEKP